MPILGDPSHSSLTSYLREAAKNIPPPTAIVVVSAHWEEAQPTIMSHPNPSLYFDYYGFPQEAYRLKYPAPGSPELAARLQTLINAHFSKVPKFSKVQAQLDNKRGFDHGMFIPLMLMYPNADIPCVQLSLVNNLNPELHIELGKAIKSLREDGVLIFASGLSFHNMRAFFSGDSNTLVKSTQFDEWLKASCQRPSVERFQELSNWANAPQARFCHPREEHLIPLFVAAGAAEDDGCEIVYNDELLGSKVSAIQFGSN
eukprot:c17625_g1_i1.p1 GENE.c17625_g1_i1~~c17625_g1_i1.p1  ORF type:complete len:284 (+),score=50.32 c17625_g1_i1:79-852(+)